MESETGYTQLLSELSSAMQDLASNPSNATYRTQFTQSLGNFTDLINEVATNYQNTQEDINNEIAIHVDTINSISSQIYSLNQQIMNIETRYGNANDLRDQRELLVDQLSELVNVTVVETPIMYGEGADATDSGATTYEVRIGGALLVDNMECRQLKVVAREEKVNQNDIDGLYDVYWVGLNDSLGDKFDFNNSNVRGLIKGLLEVRDGNNMDSFSGTITAMMSGSADSEATVRVQLAEGIDIDELNLPTEGTITLNCKEYYYDGWEAEYDDKGNLNNFVFKNITVTSDTGKREPATFNASTDVGKTATMGAAIDCKGIPYYMTQLNEFVRTLSKTINDIFTGEDENGNKAVDANGDEGLDVFTTTNLSGEDLVLSGSTNTGKLTSDILTDPSYYQLTALNWSVNQAVAADQSKVVVSYADDIAQGNLDAKDVLDKVIAAMSDQSMYSQGTVAQFLQSITTSQAVDIQKYSSFADNMNEVSTVIDNQRLSVSSVDTNEEAASLVIYQNGYNLACKIISVMNEVYDKLINETG
jgi:flagellar hook-associated protein 1 FlgK